MQVLSPHFEAAAAACPSAVASHALSCLAQGGHVHAHLNGPENVAAKALLEQGAADACFAATARSIIVVTTVRGLTAVLRTPLPPGKRAPLLLFSPQAHCNASSRYFFVHRAQLSADAAALAAAMATLPPIEGLRGAGEYGARGTGSVGARGEQCLAGGGKAGKTRIAKRASAPPPAAPPPPPAAPPPPRAAPLPPPRAAGPADAGGAPFPSSSSSSSSPDAPPEPAPSEAEPKLRLTTVLVLL
jgi:hypothetical protein